jgi:hypothetical protein
MARLFIKTLTCNETEDWTGSDECLLEVFTDAGRKTYRQDMNNGEGWEINDELPFTVRAKVRLWDLTWAGGRIITTTWGQLSFATTRCRTRSPHSRWTAPTTSSPTTSIRDRHDYTVRLQGHPTIDR